MAHGNLCINVPADDIDDVGRLGKALLELSGTLEQHAAEQAHLHDLTEQANAGFVLDQILNQLYDSFRPLIPYERISLALLERSGDLLRARWARSDSSRIRLKAGYAAPMQGSSLEKIIETGEPRILNDLEDYLREHPNSKSTRLIVEEGIKSSLTCPLIALGKPVGFLFFSSMERNTYQDVHVDLFVQIADQLSMIVEKTRLYEQLQYSNSKLQEANDKLERLSSLDGLTGIANRRLFDERLQMEWKRAIRNKTPLSLILVDVDAFKQYNDLHGHLAGDDCLRFVARSIDAQLHRPADLAARYGGEEFAAVLPETNCESAVHLAAKLRAEIEAQKMPHGQSPASDFVTISLGVATITPRQNMDADTLIATADAALYAAKEQGRNRVMSASVGHGGLPQIEFV